MVFYCKPATENTQRCTMWVCRVRHYHPGHEKRSHPARCLHIPPAHTMLTATHGQSPTGATWWQQDCKLSWQGSGVDWQDPAGRQDQGCQALHVDVKSRLSRARCWGAGLRCRSDVQLGDLVCTCVHPLGEGDDKIQQDRGFPKQNPADGWVEV